MKYGVVILIYFFLTKVHAYQEINNIAFPKGCQPMKFSEVKKNTEVMVYNLSAGDIWITYVPLANNIEAEKSVLLQAHHWSTFISGKLKRTFLCTESRPGHEQQVPCTAVIAACDSSKGRKV
jgi:hypothetical protein